MAGGEARGKRLSCFAAVPVKRHISCRDLRRAQPHTAGDTQQAGDDLPAQRWGKCSQTDLLNLNVPLGYGDGAMP